MHQLEHMRLALLWLKVAIDYEAGVKHIPEGFTKEFMVEAALKKSCEFELSCLGFPTFDHTKYATLVEKTEPIKEVSPKRGTQQRRVDIVPL